MKLYHIKNMGCDDTTEEDFELTDEQFEFLKVIFEKLNQQSEYLCMPTIHIDPKEKHHDR